jgi:hypothetical protein
MVQLGFYRAGDVIGGFEAWAQAGLPMAPCPYRSPGARTLPGLGPPEQAQECWAPRPTAPRHPTGR